MYTVDLKQVCLSLYCGPQTSVCLSMYTVHLTEVCVYLSPSFYLCLALVRARALSRSLTLVDLKEVCMYVRV